MIRIERIGDVVRTVCSIERSVDGQPPAGPFHWLGRRSKYARV